MVEVEEAIWKTKKLIQILEISQDKRFMERNRGGDSTLIGFVNRLCFFFNSLRTGPKRNLRYSTNFWSWASWDWSSISVGFLGSRGGALGSTSSTRFFLGKASGNSAGGRRMLAIVSAKNSLRWASSGYVSKTLLVRLIPNQDWISLGRSWKGQSAMASSKTGSEAFSSSNRLETVFVTPSRIGEDCQWWSEGMYNREGLCRFASVNICTHLASALYKSVALWKYVYIYKHKPTYHKTHILFIILFILFDSRLLNRLSSSRDRGIEYDILPVDLISRHQCIADQRL